MKTFNLYKIGVLAILLTCSGNFFLSCSDNEFDAKPINEKPFEVTDQQMGYLTDEKGKTGFSSIEIKDGGSTEITLFLNSNKTTASRSTVQVSYDESVLDKYNETTGNTFKAFPAGNVMLDAGGNITLGENTQKSEGLKINITTNAEVETGSIYAIPLRAQTTSGELKFSENSAQFIVLVKIIENVGDCDKGQDAVKLFCVMETNDTNPLNLLCFTLKESKKYLFDAIVLFSDNLILDKETGTVHALVNKQIVSILNNQEKYLKPLRDRGMKVILGIEAFWTHASVANMKPETAQSVARYLKTICDTYQLDGIFFDDEYDKAETPTPPGFYPTKSPEAAAYFMYEIKRLMPDKINVAYALSNLHSLASEGCKFDGKGPEYYVDYIMSDYNDKGFNFAVNYPGVTKDKWGMYSQEFARGYWTIKDEQYKTIKENKGTHFIFALNPFANSFSQDLKGSTQLKQLQLAAEKFYDEELVYDGKPYAKDY